MSWSYFRNTELRDAVDLLRQQPSLSSHVRVALARVEAWLKQTRRRLPIEYGMAATVACAAQTIRRASRPKDLTNPFT